MKTKIKFLTGVVAIAVFGVFASQSFAQTNLVSGDISLSGSWDAGLPSAANPGTIAVNGSMPGGTTLTDFVMTQTAGTVANSGGANARYNFSGGSFTIEGGTFGTSEAPNKFFQDT